MILSPARVLELCVTPAGASALAEGRRLEARHRLHLEGDPGLLQQFFDAYSDVMTPESRQALQKVAVPATKPLFGSYRDIFGKVFSARGTSAYYEFTDPELAADFDDYLDEAGVLHNLRQRFQKASLTGFQGLFLVDLPTEPNAVDEYPRPYFVFLPSKQLHDVAFNGDVVEYVIVKQRSGELDYFVCFDDNTAHVVRKNAEGSLYYAGSESVAHNLGYVPAFPPTLLRADGDNDAVRTSIFDSTLPTADVFLRDHAEHELSKKYHAFPKFWSYAVPCDYTTSVEVNPGCGGQAQYQPVYCGATGYLKQPDGQVKQCPQCKGKGKHVPVGADKTYLLNLPPPGQPGVDIRPPAGYIVPDIDTLTKQAEELKTQEQALEKAALGKEGVLAMHVKQETLGGKEIDMQPVYDRLKKYGGCWQHVRYNVTRTLAQLRYGAGFVSAEVVVGDKYQLKSAAQLESEYKAAKEAGVDDAQLQGLLEDILYTRYQDSPRELEYNLLKLHLTPIPTRSTQELLAMLAVPAGATAPVLPGLQAALERKFNLNDYVARFERENGPLVQFGIRLPFDQRIAKINETFKAYDHERSQVPA